LKCYGDKEGGQKNRIILQKSRGGKRPLHFPGERKTDASVGRVKLTLKLERLRKHNTCRKRKRLTTLHTQTVGGGNALETITYQPLRLGYNKPRANGPHRVGGVEERTAAGEKKSEGGSVPMRSSQQGGSKRPHGSAPRKKVGRMENSATSPLQRKRVLGCGSLKEGAHWQIRCSVGKNVTGK